MNQKEAAVQRLALELANEPGRKVGKLTRMAFYQSLDQCADAEYFLALARIAIEKGVVPAVREAKGQMMEFCVGRSLPVPGFPWDAVCAEVKP